MKKVLLAIILIATVSCITAPEKNKTTVNPIKTSVIPSDYDPEAIVEKLGIQLITPTTPKASYVHAVRTGNLIFLSGKGPTNADGLSIKGKVGIDLTIEEGYQAARLVGIRQLAVLKNELGNLNKVKRVVKVLGMVNAAPNFTDQPKVINGYSDLMVEIFGDRGKHARAAVGMGSLPSNIAVEVEMVVEVFE
ncbi:MAG: RidA family protein [Cellulophaga sp.]